MEENGYRLPPEAPEPPPGAGRVVWRAVLPPLLHMGIQYVILFAVTFVSMLADIVPAMMEEYNSSGSMPEISPEFIAQNLGAYIFNALFVSSLVSLLVFWFMYRRGKKHFTVTRGGPSRVIPLALVVSVAGNYAISTGIDLTQKWLGTELPTTTLDGLTEGVNPLMVILSVWLLGPIAEELCFRALSFNHLLRRFTFWRANFIQAALFGLIHMSWIQSGYAFLIGLFLGWVYHRSGRLGLAVSCHVAFNSAAVFLGLIPGIDLITEDPSRAGLYILLPSILICAVGLRILISSFSEEKEIF